MQKSTLDWYRNITIADNRCKNTLNVFCIRYAVNLLLFIFLSFLKIVHLHFLQDILLLARHPVGSFSFILK